MRRDNPNLEPDIFYISDSEVYFEYGYINNKGKRVKDKNGKTIPNIVIHVKCKSKDDGKKLVDKIRTKSVSEYVGETDNVPEEYLQGQKYYWYQIKLDGKVLADYFFKTKRIEKVVEGWEERRKLAKQKVVRSILDGGKA